jgi:DNA-binding CsgD family transcriptional regulator
MHDQFLDRQSADRVTGYLEQELWREDPFLQAILASRCTSVRMAASSLPVGRLRAFLEERGQEHVIAATQADAIAGVVTGISIFRRGREDPFGEFDEVFIDGVGPHIIDAWTHNWLLDLGAAHTDRVAPNTATAVLTAQHVLTATDDHFARLLNREWPNWRGPTLPEPLDSHIGQGSVEPWLGRDVVARVLRLQEGPIVIHVRERHALDGLAPRKREVARLFAAGASQAEVAERMKLSTSTVNNYLVDVYRELNVNDKAQLAVVVARLLP